MDRDHRRYLAFIVAAIALPALASGFGGSRTLDGPPSPAQPIIAVDTGPFSSVPALPSEQAGARQLQLTAEVMVTVGSVYDFENRTALQAREPDGERPDHRRRLDRPPQRLGA